MNLIELIIGVYLGSLACEVSLGVYLSYRQKRINAKRQDMFRAMAAEMEQQAGKPEEN